MSHVDLGFRGYRGLRVSKFVHSHSHTHSLRQIDRGGRDEMRHTTGVRKDTVYPKEVP